jgi:hypothetical protein
MGECQILVRDLFTDRKAAQMVLNFLEDMGIGNRVDEAAQKHRQRRGLTS